MCYIGPKWNGYFLPKLEDKIFQSGDVFELDASYDQLHNVADKGNRVQQVANEILQLEQEIYLLHQHTVSTNEKLDKMQFQFCSNVKTIVEDIQKLETHTRETTVAVKTSLVHNLLEH